MHTSVATRCTAGSRTTPLYAGGGGGKSFVVHVRIPLNFCFFVLWSVSGGSTRITVCQDFDTFSTGLRSLSARV